MGSRKSFVAGFAACYLIAGIISGKNAAEVPATTTAGMIYAGVMWLPLNALPFTWAIAMVPSWSFDFTERSRP